MMQSRDAHPWIILRVYAIIHLKIQVVLHRCSKGDERYGYVFFRQNADACAVQGNLRQAAFE